MLMGLTFRNCVCDPIFPTSYIYLPSQSHNFINLFNHQTCDFTRKFHTTPFSTFLLVKLMPFHGSRCHRHDQYSIHHYFQKKKRRIKINGGEREGGRFQVNYNLISTCLDKPIMHAAHAGDSKVLIYLRLHVFENIKYYLPSLLLFLLYSRTRLKGIYDYNHL